MATRRGSEKVDIDKRKFVKGVKDPYPFKGLGVFAETEKRLARE